jgi:hypothetical protein
VSKQTFISKPLYYRLYERFYSNGTAVVEGVASSHWQKYAQQFDVRFIGENQFELVGYGFGESNSGSLLARVFAWVGNTLQLANLNMPGLWKDVQEAKELVQRMGLSFSQDAFRQVCTLNILVRQMGKNEKADRILVIGDGHGILSALLHTHYPNARIFLADLGSVLFFQAYHLHKAFPDVPQTLTDGNTNGHDRAVFNFCPADRLDTLPSEELDLAINVASMQEMDPAVTSHYFALLRQRKTKLFYCCNRLEKRLVGGEITYFMKYPWLQGDEHLVDEPCPWHQWFLGRGASRHVRLLGFPVPFMHRYDGPHWHRLTRFKGE